METSVFNQAKDIEEFVMAGNATITLESLRTGRHLTYKVSRADGDKPLWFVALLTGPDNDSDYTYLGLLRPGDNGIVTLCLTAKSRMTDDSEPVRGWRYMWRHVHVFKNMPPEMEVHHEGRCGRCGRKLTVPESIERGIGPECATHMGA